MPPSPSLASRLIQGDPRSVARAISLLEDDAPEGADLIGQIYPNTGRAYPVGVTGPPGAGKSTLVDRLIAVIRAGGQTVGVIAVDPTSPFTGGAVLGDRVRMGAHAGDAGVFIRSMATRGQLGGLARATSDAALVLDAAGKDIIIIETVGVGQDEVEIVRTADISIVMLVPGAGDEVQALKAGIMEVADIFVVNKADREGADRLVQSLTATLALQPSPPGDWQPPVLKTTATEASGVAELWAAVGAFRAHPAHRGGSRHRARQCHRVRDLLAQRFLEHVDRVVPSADVERMVDDLVARRTDPYSAVTDLMRRAGVDDTRGTDLHGPPDGGTPER